MILNIKPAESMKGRIRLPASKSYSIRAFIIAACGGTSKIVSPSNSDDGKVSISAARALGAKISNSKNDIWTVKASEKILGPKRIDVHESGTTLRFILPLLSLHFKKAKVHGDGTLRGRPNHSLTRALRKMGVSISGRGRKESVPITFKGGQLKGGKVEIDGSLSSQFISALLIACPRLQNDTQISVKGKKVVSADYVVMTEQVLKSSGIHVKHISSRNFRISGRQKFKGLKKFNVPPDYGLAAFMMAAAVLVKSNVILDGYFNDRLVQADGAILPLLKRMGVRLKKTSKSIQIKGPFNLRGCSISLRNAPDLVPVMTVLALFAKGKTRLYDIGHVRVKESDRISDLKRELDKIGARITEKRTEMIIYPQADYKRNAVLDSHMDHRLAMAFSVLGLKLGVKVRDIECCRKSYPDFIRDFRNLGILAKRTNSN